MELIKSVFGRYKPEIRGWSRTLVTIAMTAMMALSAIRVLADDDDANQPLDPAAKHIQLMTWATVGVVIVVVVAAYGIRYWQLSRMDSSRPPDEQD